MNKETTELHKYWVKTIQTEGLSLLSEWEEKFFNDIEIIIHNGWSISDRQEEVLERIYEKVTR